MSIFSLKLSKDEFKFSSAHFLIFNAQQAERLHGHNYQVEFEVIFDPERINLNNKSKDSKLGYFIDFKEVKDILRKELEKLDEYVLLPKKHPDIHCKIKGKSLCVHFRDRYYEFPKNEVILLPVVNTSVEELSKYLLDRLSAQMSHYSLKGLKISIAETRGQSATLTNFF